MAPTESAVSGQGFRSLNVRVQLHDLATKIRWRVRRDAWAYAAIAAYTVSGLLLLELSDLWEMAAYSQYFSKWTTLFLVMLPAITIIFDVIMVIVRFDRRRRLAFCRTFSPARLAYFFSGTCLLMGLMIFQGTFTSIKNALPLLQGGFLYDRFQADMDSWLHFGTDPWRLLAFAHQDLILRFVDWNYSVLWSVLCFGTLYFVATSPSARCIRTRYILMFMLVWILCGNVLAGIFISAGPAFYGAVTGDTARFAELTGFLAQGNPPSIAYGYQHYLWMLYEKGVAGFASGISAFPSVHVGLIAMNALFVAERHRGWAILAFGYVLFVAASSVYLGWHYAIDGYASFVVTLICHLALRRLLQPESTARNARPQLTAAPPSGVH